MRIQTLGHKLKTGVLSLALLSSTAPLAKAAEKMAGEANLLTKGLADTALSKSNITKAATTHWDSLAEQQSEVMKRSLQNNVESGRISDILDPQKKVPSCVTLIRDTPKFKVYAIPTDSAAAISEGFDGFQDEFLKIRIAVPKDEPSATFNDCTILMKKKENKYTTEDKYLNIRKTTALLKRGKLAYIDSICSPRPEGPYYTNSYYEEVTYENKTLISGFAETAFKDQIAHLSHWKFDQNSKQAISINDFMREKDYLLETYEEVLPADALYKNNPFNELFDPEY